MYMLNVIVSSFLSCNQELWEPPGRTVIHCPRWHCGFLHELHLHGKSCHLSSSFFFASALVGYMAAILNLCKLGTYPLSQFLSTFSMFLKWLSQVKYKWTCFCCNLFWVNSYFDRTLLQFALYEYLLLLLLLYNDYVCNCAYSLCFVGFVKINFVCICVHVN